MSEERTPTRWATFSATPEIVDAVQYVVVEKDGKRFGNFKKIIEREHINGRIMEEIDHIRVSTKDGRVQLRPSDWLVIDRVGELHCYKDADFHKLFEEGTPVESSEPPEGANATDALEADIGKRFAELEGLIEKNNNVFITRAVIDEINKRLDTIEKKGASNVKSKTSKS